MALGCDVKLFVPGLSVYYPVKLEDDVYVSTWGIIESTNKGMIKVLMKAPDMVIDVNISDRCLCLTFEECDRICYVLNMHEEEKSLPKLRGYIINPEIEKEYCLECKMLFEHFCRKLTDEERDSIYVCGYAQSKHNIPEQLLCDKEQLIAGLSEKIEDQIFMVDPDLSYTCNKYEGDGIKVCLRTSDNE